MTTLEPLYPRGVRWWRWVLATFVGLVVAFGAGYLIAVFIIFPPLKTVAQGGVPVPKLTGMDFASANGALAGAGLLVGDTMTLPNIVEPAGVVVAQSPLPGQQLRRGAHVRLAISSGKPRAALPDVRGAAATRAAALLTSLGFVVAQRLENAPGAPGQVVRIEPAPGLEYDVPSQVTLVVSSGPPLADTTAPAAPAATTADTARAVHP